MFALQKRLRRPVPVVAALGTAILLAGRLEVGEAASVENKTSAVPEAVRRPIEQKNAAAKADMRRLELIAVHKETGKPFPTLGIEIEYTVGGPQDGRRSRRFVTDAQGRTVFEYPSYAILREATIRTKPSGFVPVQLQWGNTRPAIELPEKVRLELEPGTTIGGMVRDEAGKPIRDAVVLVMLESRQPGRGHDAYSIGEARTDRNGKWQCDTAPKDLQGVSVGVSLTDLRVTGGLMDTGPRKLRNLTSVMTLTLASTRNVQGRVLDSEGDPVVGASIGYGTDDRSMRNDQTTKSDKQGRFAFNDCPAAKLAVITVQAADFAPDIREIPRDNPVQPVEFRLKPASILRGRVVDVRGEPISEATVVADTWRGHRFLRFGAHTDKNGRFLWSDAPPDEVRFDVTAPFCRNLRGIPLQASNSEITITLHPIFVVAGKVTDAATEKPVQTFCVVPGWTDSWDWELYWGIPQAQNYANGHYSFHFAEDVRTAAVRVEAEGYRTAASPQFKPTDGMLNYDFRLEPIPAAKGIVHRPDGRPAKEATVALLPSAGEPLMNGRFARPGNAEMRTTGADGRFSIPTRNDPYVVVVTSDDGYAFVDDRQFVRPVSVTLTPWGKVEGTLSVRGKPASGEIVDYFPGWLREGVTTDSGHARRRVSAQYQTKTDSAGRFSFDRVIPGSGTVAREVRNKVLGRSDTAWTHKTRIAVVAGRTTQVDLRGIGRPVVGRIELPPAFAKTFDWKHSLPIEVAQVLAASDENWRPSYLVPVKADGTFRIDDVLPGHYRLHLDLRQLGPNGEWVGWTMLGEANLDFEATEQSAQHASKPLDLGTIHGRRFPSVGDMAPDFSADLVDGAKPIRLSDLRGKVVLIGFWGPGRDFKNYERSLRSWKAIVEKHAHEKGLMLLTIAPSADGARVKEVLKAAVIQGVHATVEHQLESIGPPYLVGYLPYTVIVGPDGRIAAQALGGEDLERAIDRALEEDHSLPKAKR